MKITREKVVAIHYTLRNPEGQVLDSSDGREPLYYLHGFGNLIPGMEEGLEGKTKGEKLQIKVSPDKGYGELDEALIQEVPMEAFGGNKPQVGQQFQAGNDHQRYIVTVKAVSDTTVTVDANHALAGVELHFDVEVMDVRDASQEEITHGHVHGPGGHHH